MGYISFFLPLFIKRLMDIRNVTQSLGFIFTGKRNIEIMSLSTSNDLKGKSSPITRLSFAFQTLFPVTASSIYIFEATWPFAASDQCNARNICLKLVIGYRSRTRADSNSDHSVLNLFIIIVIKIHFMSPNRKLGWVNDG